MVDTTKLRKLLKAASPGPVEIMGDGRQAFNSEEMIADFACQHSDDDDEEGLERDHEENIAEVNLYVALRNAAPELLDELDKLRKSVGKNLPKK